MKTRIIAILIIILGIAMFVYGVGMFCYAGPPLSPFVSKLGEISFSYWWTAIIFGIVLFIASYIF